MGFREAVLLGFLLLFTRGNLCVASQNWFNLSINETLNQIAQEQVTASSQLPRTLQTTDHQSNRTQQSDPARSPASYRLRSYQLRNPAVSKQKAAQPLAEWTQTFQNPQRLELTSEQLDQWETVLAQELLKLPFHGPDMNPPVAQEPKVLVKLEQRVPVPADSVAVRCGESEITIEVKQDFLGNGQLIRPSDLTLGGCAALDTADHILQFQTELQGCGSRMTMTEDALIYSFSLMYSPTAIGKTFILKTNPAEVVIECHYQRRHYVSSNAVRPTWKQFASNMLAEQKLHFSLRLMTDDWQSQRPSSVYFLSDVMHIEAAVLQAHHVPLRVYVDSCVATVNPDPGSQPRYPFINNHGCLTDAKLTGAKSYFMQRSQEDKLHFLLKAFRFHQDHRNSLYITCHLKATTVSATINSQLKACSFLTEANRWVASGGDNKVCSCCETSCTEQRRRRGLAADAGLPLDLQWEGTAALGPILLEENILLEELTEVSELPSEPVSLLQTHKVIQAASYPSIALLCGVGAALAVVLLGFMGAVIGSRLRKPVGHAVCT
ncbi:zona pellucida sperm-binding protein 3-like [Toxotes jaculatrix]|uniref:zona pellucida sperm-binding protein 3-like n=1 Tax=Toxotes jaculatrix TaxID=941984 RepID=UPI001B3B13A6|nr:zona pellucida sperm-binding protein 3-like [Toxotes jaculatrix]